MSKIHPAVALSLAALALASCSPSSPADGKTETAPEKSAAAAPSENPLRSVSSAILENERFVSCAAPVIRSCEESAVREMAAKDPAACKLLSQASAKEACQSDLAAAEAVAKRDLAPCEKLGGSRAEACLRAALPGIAAGDGNPSRCLSAFGTGSGPWARNCVGSWLRQNAWKGAAEWCAKIPEAQDARECADMAKMEARMEADMRASLKAAGAGR